MLWPILWIVAMLALITATTVVGMREKSARAKAMKKLTPQPLADADLSDMGDSAQEGFDEADPLDSFGSAENGDFAELDDNSFK